MNTENSGEIWVQSLVRKVHAITESSIMEWAQLVNQLGMDPQNREEWSIVFEKEVKNFMQDLVLDVQQTQEKLYSSIESLLKRAEELCKKLSIEMPDYGSEETGLYHEEKIMITNVKDLEEQVNKRMAELKVLMDREETICTNLGQPPKRINDSPLPSRQDIDYYIAYINELEKQQHKSEELFRNLKSNILQIAGELNYKPQLDFERTVMFDVDETFVYSAFNMKMLHDFHERMVEQETEVKKEVAHLRENIRSLWEKLGEDIQYCNDFLEKHPGNTLETLNALKVEEKRCIHLKKANIKMFVEKLRVELRELWNRCKISEEQRNKFLYYTDDTYTEELLSLHDLEIDRLKSHYETNRELFELLEKREQLWTKMLDMEERSQAPDRFKNRGGNLLTEEKTRNALHKRIPKIEEKLLELAKQYEETNGKTFLFWGESVDVVIDRCHENYENDKKERLSARKQKRDLSVMPDNLKKRTPLKATALPNSLTPMRTNTSKRNLATPMPSSAKRQKQTDAIHINGLKTAPSGINKATMHTKLRYSVEKKKRIDKLRRLSKIMTEQRAGESTKTDYNDFENELSSRGTCRSTIAPSDSNKNAIPSIKICPATPCSRSPHSKLSRQDLKLTTCSKLNMKF